MSASVERARAALEDIVAREAADSAIAPGSRTWWRIGTSVAPGAVVLLHGFANAPPQYELLGTELATRGDAVIVPRFPYHGYADRMTDAPARMRAEDWEETAVRAVALAAQCGRRVVVLGISVSGTLAAWLATRVAFDHAIAVAPFCGIRELPGRTNDVFGALLRAAPNRFLWWDPRLKERQPPPHGYPRFSTRALGESLRLVRELAPPASAAHARRLTVVVNREEPIVNNPYALRRLRPLQRLGIAVDTVTIALHAMHDVVDPELPHAHPAAIDPILLSLVDS
jgi:alpha-beta hydrolase superfamily lysophospholipase